MCSLAKQHTVFKWKDAISGFPVSQGSAEPLDSWGGKTRHHLICYFLVTLLPQIIVIGLCMSRLYDKSKVGRFLRHSVECMSKMCCTRLAEYTVPVRKNYAKNRHPCTIAQICRAISSQIRHISTIGKNLLNSYISSICPHSMVNFSSLTAEICWRVWCTPANFNGFRVLASLQHRRRSTEVNQTL